MLLYYRLIMKWFEGDVGAAISAAKAQAKIFCVFITGKQDTP